MMEENILPMDDELTHRQRRTRALIVYGVVTVIWSSLLVYALSIGAIVLNDLNTIMTLLIPISAITGFVIAWNGRLDRAIWVFAVIWWIGALGIPLTRLNIARSGVITESIGGLLGFMVISAAAWVSVSKKIRNRVIRIAGLIAIVVYALSSLRPEPAVQLTSEFQATTTIINLVLGGVALFVFVFFVRNIPNYIQGYFQQSLRNKLLIAFIGITFIAAIGVGGSLVTSSSLALSNEIRADRLSNLTSLDHDISAVLESAASDASFLISSAATQNYLEAVYTSDSDISPETALFDLNREIFALTEARGIYQEVRYIDENGQEIVRVNRTEAGGYYLESQQNLQDKSDRYYFVESIDLPEDSVYISVLDLTSERGVIQVPHKPVIRFSIPIYYENEVRGIMIVNILADNFLTFIERIPHPVFLVNRTGDFLHHPNSELEFGSQLETGINVQSEYPFITEHLFEGQSEVDTAAGIFFAHTDLTLPGQSEAAWSLVLFEPTSDVFSPVYNQVWSGILILLLVMAIAAGVSILLALQISRPLLSLTEVTAQIASGDFDVRAEISSGDEIGVLGQSVNNMAQQVGDLVHDIENQRDELERRGVEMEASQRVTFAASERTTPEDFLNLVVNLIRDVFDMYHSQVYLLNDDKTVAVLRESSGYAGRMLLQRKHAISMEQTALVTTAIKTGEPVLVTETEKDSNWLPNDLLPETKSELVVPLILEGEVLGALDIQSRIPGFFSERSVPLFQQMTNQIAFLFENSSLLDEITKQTESLEQFAAQLRVSAEIAARLNTINHLDDLLEEAVNQLQIRFNFYHAHVYMPDEAHENLIVKAGSGHIGYTLKRNKHSIPMTREASLVARAAREQKPVVVGDVTLAEGYLANPLLPNTRSEAAIPLMLGDRLIGVLDLQDENIERFSPADVDTLQTLAGQLASSIESAQFFEEVQGAEERFRALVDNAPDAIITLDTTTGKFLDVNRTAETMFGYTREEFLGGMIPSDIEPEYQENGKLSGEEDQELILRALAGETIGVERQMTRKGNEEFYVTFQVVKLPGAENVVRASVTDITERKLATLEVEQHSERFEALVNNSPDGILTLDGAEKRFVDVNRRALEMFGYTREQFLNLSPSDITAEFEPDGSNAAEKSMEYVQRAMQGEIITVERIMLTSDGVPFVVDFNLIKLPGSENLIRGSLIDITDRKAARDSIVQGDRLKSEFLANMSHELRTPLNSIIGYTDVLLMGLDGELDTEVEEDIKAIHDNGQHLLSLINDVLDLAKIEAGRMTLDVQKVDVKELLEELHKKNAGLVLNKDVEIKLNVAKGLSKINGDAHRLTQVMTNLISNAAKFTEKGSITLKAFEENDAVIMQVIDTGIGIDEEDLKAIFEEFTQVDASFSRRAEGTGLGLTITRNLVQMHGGQLDVTSKEGKGSVFSVSIPKNNEIKPEFTMTRPVKTAKSNGNKEGSKKKGSAIA